MSLKLILAVSVDAGTEIDGEGGGFATGATKVSDVVGAEIMQSKITLGYFVVTFSVGDQVFIQHSQALQTFVQVLVLQLRNC